MTTSPVTLRPDVVLACAGIDLPEVTDWSWPDG